MFRRNSSGWICGLLIVFTANPALADSISINNVFDIPPHFRTVVTNTGGTFGDTHLLNDIPGTPWDSNSTIVEDASGAAQSITVSWGIRHLLGPDPTDVNPNPLAGNLMVTYLATGTAGTFVVEKTDMAMHPLTTGGNHLDRFTLTLSVTADANRNITGYLIVYDAVHVPEPSSVALLGIGAAAVMAWRRRRSG